MIRQCHHRQSAQERLSRMAKPEATTSRAPRGTKLVSQAFFAALEDIPEASRAAVAKAAQAMIREEIKSQREKARACAASAKQKARKPASRRKVLQHRHQPRRQPSVQRHRKPDSPPPARAKRPLPACPCQRSRRHRRANLSDARPRQLWLILRRRPRSRS